VDPEGIELKATKAPTDKELKLAETLVHQLSAKFEPEKHPDEYRARVFARVDEKVGDHDTIDADASSPTKKRGSNVIDLSELLMRSLHAKGQSAKAHTPAGGKPSSRRGHATRPKHRAAR
jgi:DNA end-binding protein Ku